MAREIFRKAHLDWFTTETGRQFSLGCVIIGSFGTCCLNLLPHTFLLEKYQNVVQMYNKGKGVPIPNDLQQRIGEVFNDLNISERERKFIKPFIVYGFNMFYAGSTIFNQGAIIGIPINFTYNKVTDIQKSRLTLARQEPVDWSRPESKDLLDVLILSERAQKFGIACEILKSQNLQLIINSTSAMFIIAVMYTVSHESNKRFKLFEKPLSVRAMLYCLTGLFGFGTWILMKDIVTRLYEKSTDKKLSELGPDYIEGGLEYCDKILKRNIAIRALMGKDGQKMFSSNGNELSLWRQKRLQILSRKHFFQEKMQNFNFM